MSTMFDFNKPGLYKGVLLCKIEPKEVSSLMYQDWMSELHLVVILIKEIDGSYQIEQRIITRELVKCSDILVSKGMTITQILQKIYNDPLSFKQWIRNDDDKAETLILRLQEMGLINAERSL